MRIRTIKPAFWTSQDVATLPDDTHRLLFVGLWNYVDDEGRGADDPRLIKAALFPLNDAIRPADIDAMLWRLPSVLRYEAGDRDYLAISTWEEHQKISHPKPSVIPPPEQGEPRRRRHGTLLEASRLEVEGNREQGSGREGNGVEAAARAVDNNPNQPLETQIHFGESLGLKIPAIVKLNIEHGREYVTEAMRQIVGFPPADPITDTYAYVASVASFKAAAVSA